MLKLLKNNNIILILYFLNIVKITAENRRLKEKYIRDSIIFHGGFAINFFLK